ncbi:MAG: DUF6799 domain-containing protein [Chitinophagales bacterium]
MKKIMFLIMACALGVGAFAQVNYTVPQDPPLNVISIEVSPMTEANTLYFIEYYTPQGCITSNFGYATLYKDKSSIKVNSDVLLANGARVSPSGLVYLKDGTKYQIKNGTCIGMDGGIYVIDNKSLQINTDVGESH